MSSNSEPTLILGTMLAVLYAFGAEFVRGVQTSERKDVREFAALRADIIRELPHLLQSLHRGVARRIGP